MNSAAVLVRWVEVHADRRRILSVPELAIEPGEVLGILGPNGAGKTTLLRMCQGFQRPSAGDVSVLGKSLRGLSTLGLTRLRRSIGYVPQELAAHSFLPLTVREVVAIGRTGRAGLLRPLGRGDWQVVDAWIERLGLASLAAQPYAQLSGGEQRKTLIARAMVQEPRILMLDEPTAFLDLGWRERIVGTLDQLCGQGDLTMILVCHELEVLPRCCRRLLLLDGGEVRAEGAPEDVLTDERVARLYGSGLRVLHQGGRHAVVPTAEAAQ